jgi:hypothetical protein
LINPAAFCGYYATREEAIAAVKPEPNEAVAASPTPAIANVSVEFVEGVACFRYDYQDWSAHAVRLQSELRDVVEKLGHQSVVVNFSGQVRVGTPSMASLFALCYAVHKCEGRFAFCSVSRDLVEFFQWHSLGTLLRTDRRPMC